MNREQIDRIESMMTKHPEGEGLVGIGQEKIPAWVFSLDDILTLIKMARTSLQLPQLLNAMEDLKLRNRNLHDELAETRRNLKESKQALWMSIVHQGGFLEVDAKTLREVDGGSIVSITKDPVSGNLFIRALGRNEK